MGDSSLNEDATMRCLGQPVSAVKSFPRHRRGRFVPVIFAVVMWLCPCRHLEHTLGKEFVLGSFA